MKIKTISYKRVLNLGNYENKHLELFAEVDEGENPEEAILQLADIVERTIREKDQEIKSLLGPASNKLLEIVDNFPVEDEE